ncbi:MAG TPA: glycosyltransferase family 39 protein [Candidatus Acidoferrales bacterium]|nr:glycosyltransferase family 39 protein [Candidatus Acidoferrales bacterium]
MRAPAPAEASILSPTATAAILTAVAMLLRVAFVGRQSFWGDEAATAIFARMQPRDMLQLLTTHESAMAMYFVLARFWTVLGDDEATLRMLSVIFAAATVPPLYFLARRLAGARVATVATLLFAVNAFAIRYAQEARSYSLWLLLVVASWIYFLRLVERPVRWNVAGYIAAGTLAVYAHFFAIFSLAAQWLVVFLGDPQRLRLRPLLVGGFAIAILSAPLLVALRLGDVGQTAWIEPIKFLTIQQTVYGFSGSLTGGPVAWLLPAICVGLAGFGMLAMYHSSRGSIEAARNFRFVVLGLAVPIAGLVVVSLAKPTFVPRYAFESLPFFSILVAIGLCKARRSVVGASGLAAIVCLSLYQDYRYYRVYPRDDWRAATAYLLGNSSPGDAAILFSEVNRWPYEYYVSRLGSPPRRPTLIYPDWDRQFRIAGAYALDPRALPAREAIVMKVIDEAPARFPRIWLVQCADRNPMVGNDVAMDKILAALSKRYRAISEKGFFDIQVTLYERTREP